MLFRSTAENQNYAGEASAVFTIDKATLTTVVLKDTLFTYTYSDITVSIASVKAGDLEVSADGYTLSGLLIPQLDVDSLHNIRD